MLNTQTDDFQFGNLQDKFIENLPNPEKRKFCIFKNLSFCMYVCNRYMYDLLVCVWQLRMQETVSVTVLNLKYDFFFRMRFFAVLW